MVERQKRLHIELINQTINLFWTAFFLVPVIWLWFQYYDVKIFSSLLGFSLIPLLMNEAVLQEFQLSGKKKFYEQLGIKKFQAVTQHGKIINTLIRKKYPGYKVVKNPRDVMKYKRQIEVYEKYHMVCFLFFMGSIVYGSIKSEFYLAGCMFISNIFYNVAPILVQQYNKIRMGLLIR